LEEAEAESGKILKEAEDFWQNKLEANSEVTNFIQSRKQKIPRVRKRNLEAWHFKRSWKWKQKIFYCFHIPGSNKVSGTLSLFVIYVILIFKI